MPTYSLPTNLDMSYSEIVDQIMEWLTLPDNERPRFISVYLSAVDSAGHEYGPGSTEVHNAIQLVDDTLGSLSEKVSVLDIAKLVNYMIVSDHGMAMVDPDNVIYLDDYIDIQEDADVITWGHMASIRGLYGRGPQLYYQLQNIEGTTVYNKESIPEEYHYQNNDRIPDVLLVADEGWYITARSRGGVDYKVGDHGYEPSLPSMKSFFVGSGDFFKESYENTETISNLHLYSLMARMLNVSPAPNNGSWVSLCPLLNDQC